MDYNNNQEKLHKENDDMNGGVGTDQAATLALLADTARAGRGWGYGHGGEGGYGCGSPFANVSTIQHGLRNNRQSIEDQADCTREVLGLGLDRLTNCFESAERARQFNGVTDQLFRTELRNGDRLRDVERDIAANAKEAAKCCCETQKEIIRLEASNNLKFADLSKQQAVDTGAINAQLSAINAKIDANKEIGELRAQLQTQQIFATCGCGCGGGVKPCPPCGG